MMFFFDVVLVIRVHFSLEGGREVRVRGMHYRYLSKTFLIPNFNVVFGGEDIFLIFFFLFFFFQKSRFLDLHMSKREKKKKAYKGQQELMINGSRSANIGTCRLSLGGAGMCKC